MSHGMYHRDTLMKPWSRHVGNINTRACEQSIEISSCLTYTIRNQIAYSEFLAVIFWLGNVPVSFYSTFRVFSRK